MVRYYGQYHSEDTILLKITKVWWDMERIGKRHKIKE